MQEVVNEVLNEVLNVRSERFVAIAVAFVIVLMAAGASPASATEPDVPPAARAEDPNVRAGAEAFLANGCAACHRLDAAGATGLFGPVLNGAGQVAAARVASPDYRGAASDGAGYLRESIVAPAAYLVPGYAGSYHRMPAYAHLSDEELDSLIALLTWTAPEGRNQAP